MNNLALGHIRDRSEENCEPLCTFKGMYGSFLKVYIFKMLNYFILCQSVA
jgi:hypothetical protein